MNNKPNTIDKNLLASIKACENSYLSVIRKRLGISILHHQIDELYKTIADACEKFNYSPIEYLQMITEEPDNSPLLEHLVIGITIGESYFFRDKHQMKLLQKEVLPDIIQSKRNEGNLLLRIWSAGCSRGEEIYTIAIMLKQLLPDIQNWTIDLLGTDINTNALQKGIMGCYSEWSMRSISKDLISRYFTRQENKFILLPDIREMVEFSYLNLNENTYPSIFNGTNAQDLILCRNVLIYFDNNSINKLMNKLRASLIQDGYLLLGASDPIDIQNTKLTRHSTEASLFLNKPLEASLPIPKTIQEPSTIKSFAKSLSKEPKKQISVNSNNVESDSDIRKLLDENLWQEALDLIKNKKIKVIKSAFLLSAEAMALANLGQLPQAVESCRASLQFDSTNKHTYLTLAMILMELNNLQEAENSLRKTLFLDHKFVMGHYQLGLLLLRKKQHAAGLKCLKNAFEIAIASNSTEMATETLNYGRLAEILKHEIALHASGGEAAHADTKT